MHARLNLLVSDAVQPWLINFCFVMYLHMGSSAYLAMGGHLPMTHSCGPSCYVDMGLRLLFFFFFLPIWPATVLPIISYGVHFKCGPLFQLACCALLHAVSGSREKLNHMIVAHHFPLMSFYFASILRGEKNSSVCCWSYALRVL